MLPEGDKVPLGAEDGEQRDFAQLLQLGRRRRQTNVDRESSLIAEHPIITPHENVRK